MSSGVTTSMVCTSMITSIRIRNSTGVVVKFRFPITLVDEVPPSEGLSTGMLAAPERGSLVETLYREIRPRNRGDVRISPFGIWRRGRNPFVD